MTNRGSVYFNEFDDATASWLLRLAVSGNLNYAEFKVDRRSVVDVRPADLTGYTECNFFAGIGGWRRALHLAGVDVYGLCNRIGGQLWTASLPCQPFSVAGKGRGVEDERHLWPVFRELVSECKPAIIFGEQVASRDGREWLSGVRSDLEALGYAVGAADLCAACVNAPHIRQRLYWVAYTSGQRGCGRLSGREGGSSEPGRSSIYVGQARSHSLRRNGRSEEGTQPEGLQCSTRRDGDSQRLGDSCEQRLQELPGKNRLNSYKRYNESSGMGNEGNTRRQNFWDDYSISPCRDPKRGIVYRRTPSLESSIFPLVNGVFYGMGHVRDKGVPITEEEANATSEARTARLRGYGNAIVPQLAAVFIRASLSTLPEDMRKLASP